MAKNLNVPELIFTHPERAIHLYRYKKARQFISGTVLDVACGWGYGSFILQDKAKKIIGFDNDQSALDYAIKHYSGIDFQYVDIEKNKLPRVDCVVTIETVEHLINPLNFIRKIKESADLIFLSTPCVPTVGANPDHLHDFTEQDVLGWFKNWEILYEENQIGIYKLICARRKI